MDQRVRAEIRARIRHLHDETGNTTIYVTHDQAEAISLCDRMVILHKAELQQIGTVEEVWNRPANRFVAYFVGEPAMNFVSGKVEGDKNVSIPAAQGKMSFKIAGEIDRKYVGAVVTIGIRPQQIKVHRSKKEENSIPCAVRVIEFQGETTVLTTGLGDGAQKTGDGVEREVKAVVPATERYSVGETVWLHFDPEFIHLFDGETPILRRKGRRQP
jgi:multiple sugar transport system ATP-binding protein